MTLPLCQDWCSRIWTCRLETLATANTFFLWQFTNSTILTILVKNCHTFWFDTLLIYQYFLRPCQILVGVWDLDSNKLRKNSLYVKKRLRSSQEKSTYYILHSLQKHVNFFWRIGAHIPGYFLYTKVETK